MSAESFLDAALDASRYRYEEALAIPHEPHEDGAWRILRERRRQVEQEGWTAEHDDGHSDMGLLDAAACYIQDAQRRELDATYDSSEAPFSWPWHVGDWKPGDPVRNLEKAGALIAAEIDRIERSRGDHGSEGSDGGTDADQR